MQNYAQHLVNLRSSELIVGDTLVIDSLSLVPGSVFLNFDGGKNIPDSLFDINYAESEIVFDKSLNSRKLQISYRVFPIKFTSKYAHKRKELYYTNEKELSDNEFIYSYDIGNYNTMFGDALIDRRGSIARGISVGNNQNVVMNSHLNLQLSGKLSDDIEIVAAISDNNIPIQPDGTSQQLQEFDKVFIKIFNPVFSLIAGDYEITSPQGYFAKYYKKVQGAQFTYSNNVDNKNNWKLTSSISGAVAKGKYNRQQIQGQEGVLGPYKLRGANGESFIVILAGTEKVYIDGVLLTRGLDYDYIIDYNTAEISFTPKQAINKDKRIIVEFEYSERSYARFSVTSNHLIENENSAFWLNIYSEKDNKNQAFDQDLSAEDRYMLSQIGDNLSDAFVPNIDSVGFSGNEIRYKLTDTIVNSYYYDSIYEYSTNPDEAVYRLGFAFVGSGNGNYIKSISAANGRVYKWVAPISGISQGEYEPVVLLVTPKKKQMFTVGGDTKLWQGSNLIFELGLSDNDINTFSKKDAGNNKGTAAKFKFLQDFKLNDKSIITANTAYQLINRNFEGIEHFRDVEFTRNWNLTELLSDTDEHIISAGLNYKLMENILVDYKLDYLSRNNEYSGINNRLVGSIEYKSWLLDINGALLKSQNDFFDTEFLRHKAVLKKSFKGIIAGISEEQEYNIWQMPDSTNIALNSFSFNEYRVFINTVDTIKNGFDITYKYRQDKLPQNDGLINSTNSQDFVFGLNLLKNPNNTLRVNGTYRLLEINDTSLVSIRPEDNLTGRIEYGFKVLKGLVSSNTFYEIGAGLERKTEFSYLEVAPGQGVYQWTDYNGNGVKELNEFEIAFYQDQANYIRIFTPTDTYVKTYTNQFNQNLSVNPRAVWHSSKGIKKFISKFSNQLAYRISSKNTSKDFFDYANPFSTSISDTALVNMNAGIRNSFSFNKGNPKFGIDYIYQNNHNKTMLVNGFDTRGLVQHGGLLRWNITPKWMLQNTLEKGEKNYSSEFFSDRNYQIDFYKNIFELSLQPNNQHRVSIIYQWKNKSNKSGNELLTGHDFGLEYRMSSSEKGVLSAKLNYVFLGYDGLSQGAVGYEMLEGLQPGNNITWQINYQRQLANGLMVNIDYSGRGGENSKIIHVGSVQIRAFF